MSTPKGSSRSNYAALPSRVKHPRETAIWYGTDGRGNVRLMGIQRPIQRVTGEVTVVIDRRAPIDQQANHREITRHGRQTQRGRSRFWIYNRSVRQQQLNRLPVSGKKSTIQDHHLIWPQCSADVGACIDQSAGILRS